MQSFSRCGALSPAVEDHHPEVDNSSGNAVSSLVSWNFASTTVINWWKSWLAFLLRRLYSYVLWWESSLCKTPHFQWIYGKLNQIYEKLRSDQMDPKSALGGPKPISRTGGSLLKNWSYTSNQCIYFSILLDWRSHLAKTLFILHKYIKCALL